MNKPLIDISALKNAALALSNCLVLSRKVEAKTTEEREFYEYELCRAAAIQHFEFCYELGWKFMQRWLDVYNGDEVDGLSKKALFRLAEGKGLISDFEKWLQFMTARNMTSHTYGEEAAEAVYSAAKISERYIHELVSSLEKKI